MTNKKLFISITGTTCVGKSTLLKALKQSNEDQLMIIPQITCREQRTDDDPNCFVYVNNINPDDMFIHNKELSYGISKQSIEDFMNSNCKIAVAINGTDELEMLKKQKANMPNIKFRNILLTFSNNYDKEITSLEKQLIRHFDKGNASKRFNFFKTHIKNKLLNPDFIKNNIDLHLTRESSMPYWCLKIAQLSGIASQKLIKNLQTLISTGHKQRKYINPKVSYGINQIILALKGNTR